MGWFEYVSDLCSSVTIQSASAESPDTSGVDRGSAVKGGASTSGKHSGTNEESDAEADVNKEDAKKATSRSESDDGGDDGGDDEEEQEEEEPEEEEEEEEEEPEDPMPKLQERMSNLHLNWLPRTIY